MKLTKLQGVVIKEINTGEADKIITILTKRLGSIQASAIGARRPQSRLIAGTQLLCFSDFVLSKAKDMYVVRSCDVQESFYNIRTSLDKITYTSHILDIVNEISEENLSYPKLLQLLLNTLHLLSYSNKSPDFITEVFELRLMGLIGYAPSVIECVGCGNVHSDNVTFSYNLGGILCNECANKDRSSIKISAGTLSSLRYILYSELKRVFSFEVSNYVLEELKKVSEKFLSAHLHKSFEKLKFLDNLRFGEVTNESKNS